MNYLTSGQKQGGLPFSIAPHFQIPNHVAIIMDGNGRWAERKGYPRVFGHIRGCKRVKETVRHVSQLGVKVLTLFAFSTENWQRAEGEVRVLWKLLRKYLISEIDELHRNNVQFQAIGEIGRLPKDIQTLVGSAQEKLSHNNGLKLVLALSYGARREIIRAAQRISEDCMVHKIKSADITEDLFSKYLWSSEGNNDSQDVDLLIRTGGDRRVSNFLLWQMAYSELVFTNTCWPDFTLDTLYEVLEEYSKRERRFGSVLPLST